VLQFLRRPLGGRRAYIRPRLRARLSVPHQLPGWLGYIVVLLFQPGHSEVAVRLGLRQLALRWRELRVRRWLGPLPEGFDGLPDLPGPHDDQWRRGSRFQ